MSFYATDRTYTGHYQGIHCDGPDCMVQEEQLLGPECPNGWFEVRQGEWDCEANQSYGDSWHFHSLLCLETWVSTYDDALADEATEYARWRQEAVAGMDSGDDGLGGGEAMEYGYRGDIPPVAEWPS